MALTPGTRLGPYEVVSAIGAGGMGQVYRARDAKLNRDVALKVIPEAFAADADRLARFTREAQVLASLNHPNIAQIYGIEGQALVMELVEGDDLSTIIARGPMSCSDTLPIAKQIAEALDAAHEQGIIHRDLKPANVKVRADGTVKVLDFGLAKAMDSASALRASAGQAPSQSPTITSPAMTAAGMILGTAAYMSPEQARGKPVDRRADIWAFGAVVYEMLTGRRAFEADDVSLTMARVLEREPDFDALPSAVPARIGQALRVCLRKDPRQRASAIRDVQLALEGAFETSSITPDVKMWPTRFARALPWVSSIAALVFAIAWLVAWAPWRAATSPDRPVVRLDVDLGADVSLPALANLGSNIAIAPDGTRLVYASGSPARLFTRRLDQTKATELPGTQGATVPFFSPDGQWVGFVSGRRVNKISVDGGAVVPLGGEANVSGAGASWGEDGSLFIASLQKLLRIPADGGPPETVAESRNGEIGLVNPDPLPGSKAVLFAADNPGPVDKTTIEVVNLGTRERKTLVHGGASPRYLATADGAGYLVYVNQATLFAIPFDLRTLETHGSAVPILDDVASERTIGTGQFDISRTGTLVYRKTIRGESALTRLQSVDATGRKELQARPGVYEDLSLSPDGTRVALTVIDGATQDVWIYDSQRDAMTRLTFGGATYRAPAWSPDGRYVVFSSVSHGIVQVRADGAGSPHVLTESNTIQYPRSFTADGNRLAYYENLGGAGGAGQLWTVPISEEGGQLKAGKAEPFLKSNSHDRFPSFSPDGRWLAYESSESGATEVYVRAFPPPASQASGKWQISTSGGGAPRWSPSGRDLLYQSGDQILAASYTVNGDTFVADKPRVWIARLGAAPSGVGGSTWDLTRDGTHVVVATPVESADGPRQEHQVVLVQNFFDELRRRMPPGK